MHYLSQGKKLNSLSVEGFCLVVNIMCCRFSQKLPHFMNVIGECVSFRSHHSCNHSHMDFVDDGVGGFSYKVTWVIDENVKRNP